MIGYVVKLQSEAQKCSPERTTTVITAEEGNCLTENHQGAGNILLLTNCEERSKKRSGASKEYKEYTIWLKYNGVGGGA